MSNERDTTRIVRSWLEEGVTTLPDRVLDAVLDQVPATPQARALLPSRRIPTMNTVVRTVLAAAVAVVAVGVGIYALSPAPGSNIGGASQSLTTTATPVASATAASLLPTPLPTETALPLSNTGVMAPGTYLIGDRFPVRLAVTVGDGWRLWSRENLDGGAIYKESPDPPNGRGLVFSVVGNVYADGCDTSKGPLDPPLGPSVDDLATALAGQPLTVASPITDVTLDGYSGKYLEYSVPIIDPACNHSSVYRWPTVAGPRQGIQGESDRVWILDVDGTRLVLDVFFFPGVTEADLAEIQEIVESIQIGPPAAD